MQEVLKNTVKIRKTRENTQKMYLMLSKSNQLTIKEVLTKTCKIILFLPSSFNADLYKKVQLQRQMKCLFDLFSIFFVPETMKLYSGVAKYLNTNNYTFKQKQLDNPKQEMRLSVALGQIVQAIIHLAAALGITCKFPMVFNGHRSIILTQKQE